jgi:hypothetical protein
MPPSTTGIATLHTRRRTWVRWWLIARVRAAQGWLRALRAWLET